MFGSKKTIIYFTKNQLAIATVSLGSKPSVSHQQTFNWNYETLTDVVGKLAAQISSKSAVLLLSSQLSYVLPLTIDPKISATQLREDIFTQFQEVVPDIYTDSQWDFKVVAKNNKEKRVVAFAPVKKPYQALSKALINAGITIQAVEPVAVAKIRNENPLIGIAMKKDLKGSDAEVLNIGLFEQSVPPAQHKKTSHTQKPQQAVGKGYLLVLVLVIVVGAIVLGIKFYPQLASFWP